jgi:hypothetical protein
MSGIHFRSDCRARPAQASAEEQAGGDDDDEGERTGGANGAIRGKVI